MWNDLKTKLGIGAMFFILMQVAAWLRYYSPWYSIGVYALMYIIGMLLYRSMYLRLPKEQQTPSARIGAPIMFALATGLIMLMELAFRKV